jgi:hypothetical protein
LQWFGIHLQRGKSLRRIQRFYRRYRIKVQWIMAVRGVKQRLYEMAQQEKRQRALESQRVLVITMAGMNEERAARAIQAWWRELQKKWKEREVRRKVEEAKRKAEEARKKEEQEYLEWKQKKEQEATLLSKVGGLVKKITTTEMPDETRAVFQKMKKKAKKAEFYGSYADDDSHKSKQQLEQQAESALIKFHSRTSQMGEWRRVSQHTAIETQNDLNVVVLGGCGEDHRGHRGHAADGGRAAEVLLREAHQGRFAGGRLGAPGRGPQREPRGACVSLLPHRHRWVSWRHIHTASGF